jgi:CRP-like cAMP-binding protein
MDHPITLETVISFLLETPLFADLDPAELAEVVRIMQVQRLRDGQVVFTEGSRGDAWFVIFEGKAEVTKEMPFGPPRQLAMIDERSCFGEMAILDGSDRSATVTARGELTLFRFRKVLFEELMAEGSLAAYKLVAAMARLLSQRHRRLTQQISDMMDQEEPTGQYVRNEIGGLVDQYKVSE